MCSEGCWGPTSSGWASGAGLGLVPAAPLVRVPHLLRCGRRAPAGEGRLGAELDSRSASHARQVVGTKCRHASFARSYGFSASRCVSRLFPAKSQAFPKRQSVCGAGSHTKDAIQRTCWIPCDASPVAIN